MIRLLWLVSLVVSLSTQVFAQQTKSLAEIQKASVIQYIKIQSAPPDVLAAIKAAPIRSKDSFSGYRIVDEQVIRVDQLTINALSTTQFLITSAPPNFPFFVIAARVINMEVPANRKDAARVGFLPKHGSLLGPDGAQGKAGRGWPADWTDQNGDHGGDGLLGDKGERGRTLDLPQIYFVYQNLFVSGGTPNASLGLAFDLDGIKGGTGGLGGKGGTAGSGARGTGSSCSSGFIPVPYCICDAGPGIGGNAGRRGPGGQGGDAGRGGNGGTLHFVGPTGSADSYTRVITGFMEVMQSGSEPGSPGQPGSQGDVGSPGGGGEKCTCCNGRGSGSGSPSASPVDWGLGNVAVPGQRGIQSLTIRDNSDLF